MESKSINIIRKARGANISRQTQRVYLCYNPADIDKIDTLITDILSHDAGIDCVVTFLKSIEDFDKTILQDELVGTQLLIVYVTNELIKDPNGLPIDYNIAKDKNIPVLPVAEDDSLLPLFTEKAGNLHGIAMNDPEYRHKFKTQLENFLASENLRALIDSKAFTAELFLSYRKIDLDDARKFMKELHDISGLQGVSIWYDHFLTAGREFDIEIKEAIERSKAFVLLVTPNITKKNVAGELNYVAKEEVPFALKKEKTIFPVEVKPRDTAAFPVIFPEIGEPILKETINNVFKHKLGDAAYIKTLGSERAYLLGMAYLRGHKIERDYDRAVNLLETATNYKDQYSLNASEQLANIYQDGLGGIIQINYDNALKWLYSAAAISEKIKGNKHILTAAIYKKIGIILCVIGHYTEALDFHKQALNIYINNYGKYHVEVGLVYSQIGKVYTKTGHTSGTSILYDALKIFQKEYGENHAYTADQYMDIGINHLENEWYRQLHDVEDMIYNLGKDYAVDKKNVDYDEEINKASEHSLNNFNKALEIYKNIYGGNNYYTAKAYNYIGKALINAGKQEKGLEELNIALEIINSIYGENHLYSVPVYENMGLLYKNAKDYEKSLVFYEKAISLRKPYFNEDNVTISPIFESIADVYLQSNNTEEALKYYIKAIEIIKNNFENDPENIVYEKKILEESVKMEKIDDAINNKWLLIFNILKFIIMLPFNIIISIPKIIVGFMKFGKILTSIKKMSKNINSTEVQLDGLGESVMENFGKNDNTTTVKTLMIKIADKYVFIGKLFNKIKDHKNAAEYFKMAVEMKRRIGFDRLNVTHDKKYMQLVINTGVLYFIAKDYENSHYFCNHALEMHNKDLKIEEGFKKTREKLKRIQKFKKEIEKNEGNVNFELYNIRIADLYNTLGELYYFDNKYTEALEFFTNATETLQLLPIEEENEDYSKEGKTEENINKYDFYKAAFVCLNTGKTLKQLKDHNNAILNINIALQSFLFSKNKDDEMLNEIISEIIDITSNINEKVDTENKIIKTEFGDNLVIIKYEKNNDIFNIELIINNEDDVCMFLLYDFAGYSCIKLKQEKKGIEYCKKALEYYNELIEMNKDYSQLEDEEYIKFLKDKIKIENIVYGKDSIEEAKTCYLIGCVYKDKNNQGLRLKYYKKGLEIRIKINGEDNIDTATQYNNVAVAYNSLGDRKKATENHEKVMAIRLKLLGENHLSTASSYVNIAYVYRDMEDYEKALEYFSKGLIVRKKLLKPDDKRIEEAENQINKISQIKRY
jgi:tetratricopeptide (TPR) repeat protein